MFITRKILKWCDNREVVGPFIEGMIDGAVLVTVYLIMANCAEAYKSEKK